MRRAFLFLPGVARSVQPGIQPQGKFLRITPVRTPAQTTPAESAHATSQNEWDYVEFTWAANSDQYGRYTATSEEPMLVESAKGPFGDLAADDYVVLYLSDKDKSGTLTRQDHVVTNSTNGVCGAYPREAGNYVAVVYAADEWAKMQEEHAAGGDAAWFDKDGNIVDTWYWTPGGTDQYAYQAQAFRIADEAESKSLEGAFAFEVDADETGKTAGTREDFADTTLQYLGVEDLTTVSTSFKVSFAVDGEELVEGTDYVVDWACSDSAISQMPQKNNTAGFYEITNAKPATYTATLYGMNDYAGSEATVQVTVDPIDLANDVIAIATQDDATGYTLGAAAGADVAAGNYAKVTVNGEALLGSEHLTMVATQFEGLTGTPVNMPTSANISSDKLGVYTFRVAPAAGAENPYVVGAPASIDGLVVKTVVSFYYGNTPLVAVSSIPGSPFTVGDKVAFDRDELAAYTAYNTVEADFTATVTKDGAEVSDFTQPGTYVVELDSAVTPGFASAGHKVVTFEVVEKAVQIADVFYQVDGKAVDGTFYYTSEPYDVQVVAYDAKKNVLTEGEDYTVAYKLDGKEVESMVDADEYTIEVTPAGSDKAMSPAQTFTISPAPVKSAKADQALYAYTGDVVEPTFTGYTKDGLTGLSVALNADNAKITYKKWDGKSYVMVDGKATDEINWENGATAVSAGDLKDEGTYQATIELPAGFKNFGNADTKATAVFEISKTASYADVAADAWYAESVYTAASEGFGYMTGIPGTNLFLPEGQITRAQVAQVLYNMAGGNLDPSQSYPTQFTDVEPDAWYAAPIFWASQAGIVTGIGDTGTFAPNDPVTREQVATMLYRYMKAQGKDVSGSADLAAYADGSSVSGWAAEAMAWAVDAEVFGVGTDVLRPQDDMSRAEMAATAVRVQPDGMIERA